MKGKKIVLSILLIMAVLIIIFVELINKNRFSRAAGDDKTEQITKNIDSCNIIVDPRIELLTAVQLQAGYSELTRLDFKYRDDMKQYFNKYKNHKAVGQFKKISSFSYDAPPTAMLYLTNPPELKQDLEFNDEIISRAGSNSSLMNIIKNLRTFGKISDFSKFYNKNIPFYKGIIDEFCSNIKDKNIVKALNEYYGMPVNSYNIILAPLLHSGGYGPCIKRDNGLNDLYAIIGPENTRQESDGSYIPEFSVDNIRYLVWHEFSHSFVNPEAKKYLSEINKYNSLYQKISKQMEVQAYPNWEVCVNEHIVRAVTARLTSIYLGEAAGEQVINQEKSHGFYYIEALCDSLKYYESNRNIYPDFKSYYPELIKVFKNLSEQKLPDSFYQTDFTGPINNAFTNMSSADIVLISPTNEQNQNSQDKITKYIETIRDKFFQNAEIIKDTEALKEDLSNNIIVAYGTMAGNLWLDYYKNTFPFQINSDKIKADKDYDGTGMVFISAMPNPQNFKNPLIIYTAQDSDDIVNINNVFHGGTDYVVAKDYKEIQSGFYDKNEGKWTFKD